MTVIGALDDRVGLRHYEIISHSNTGEAFGNFIHNLAKKLDGRIATLVLDNLRVHHSKKVTEVMKDHPNLSLLYLPVYSCRLNPIEHLWNIIKQKWRRITSDIEDYQPNKPPKIISMVEKVIDGIPAATCINVF